MFVIFNSLFGDLFYANGVVENGYVDYIAYSHYFVNFGSQLDYYKEHDFHATYDKNLRVI